MARLRTTRSIAKRIDLSYFKQEHPFRRAKRNLSILLALTAGIWPAALAFKDDQTIFSGGPMSVRHSQVADSCRDCHRADYAQRWLHPERWQAEMDLDCLRCHAGPAHHLNQTDFLRGQMAAKCSVCHQEHHGRPQLSELKAEHCAQCHADLQKLPAVAEPHHPQCLIKRDHLFDVQITSFETDHPDFQVVARHAEGKASDPTKLQFNHYEHLVPDTDAKRAEFQKLLKPMAARPGVGPGHAKHTLKLQCAFCHQPDGDGEYLKPVRYEQHCRDCHSLAAEIDGEPVRLPHEMPDVVRDFLRSRLAGGKDEDELSIAVFEQETFIFDADPAACSKCHVIDMGDASPEQPPVLEDTGIHRGRRGYEYEGEPRRWLVHSRFDHNAHRELRCTQCHTATEQSKLTSDILIPAMWSCKQCHSQAGGARTTCVECHTFHDHSRDLGIEGTLRVGEMRR